MLREKQQKTGVQHVGNIAVLLSINFLDFLNFIDYKNYLAAAARARMAAITLPLPTRMKSSIGREEGQM